MDHTLRNRLATRESGRRRIGTVTSWTALGATGLAAAFGLVFANSSAASSTNLVQSPAGSSTDGSGQENGDGTGLQPPAQLPTQQPDGSLGGGSGGSVTTGGS